MAKVKVHIEGLRELGEALQELSKATGKNVVRRVLLKAAQPIADDASSRARVRKGTLSRSTAVGTKLSRRQKGQHQKVSDVEVFAGAGALVQAITEEFGTVSQSPHPFMRPAWDTNKMRALDGIKGDLAAEIEKARERQARRAARLLAKR